MSIRRQRGRARTLRTVREAFSPRCRERGRFRESEPRRRTLYHPVRGIYNEFVSMGAIVDRSSNGALVRV